MYELQNVTLDHKTSHKGLFFNWDVYIIWKLNK